MIEYSAAVLRCHSHSFHYEPCSVTVIPNHLFVEDHRRKLLSVHYHNILHLEIQPHDIHQNENCLHIHLNSGNLGSSVSQLTINGGTDEFHISIDDLQLNSTLSRIRSSWFHYQISKSADIAFNFEKSDAISRNATHIYHNTLQSLKGLSIHDYHPQAKVYSLFSKEVVRNLCLKEICFQNREIFIVAKEALKRLLSSPLEKNTNVKPSKSRVNEDEVEDRRLRVILERIKLFKQILATLVAVLHGSLVIVDNKHLISELPGPFHISSWLDLLTVDVFEMMSLSVGYQVCHDFEVIAGEVDRAIAQASQGVQLHSTNFFKSNLTWNMSQSVVNTEKFREPGETDSYIERVLTPLKSSVDYSSLEFSQNFGSSASRGLFPDLEASLNQGYQNMID